MEDSGDSDETSQATIGTEERGKKRAFHPLSTDATKQEKENVGGAAELSRQIELIGMVKSKNAEKSMNTKVA